ncbi:hypothetical protein ACFWZZ_10575 [[Kitasatospora] papulosa]|uniref:hypothetical protein n=1 Tax=[Kitasatospora] papulosa TaxID=1464011 RepID=UPI0036A37F23
MHLGLVVAAPADELLVVNEEVTHVVAVLTNLFRQRDHMGHLVIVNIDLGTTYRTHLRVRPEWGYRMRVSVPRRRPPGRTGVTRTSNSNSRAI